MPRPSISEKIFGSGAVLALLVAFLSGAAGHWREWWVELLIILFLSLAGLWFYERLIWRGIGKLTSGIIATVVIALIGGGIVAAYRLSAEPKSSAWQPPELPKGCKTVTVSLGTGVYSTTPVSVLIQSSNGQPIFMLQGETPVRACVQSNRFFVDVNIPFPLGPWHQITNVHIRGNSITSMPPEWDMNHNSNAVEIVNSHNMPIYQVFYKSPDHIRVMGIFSSRDRVCSYGENGWSQEPTNATAEWLALKPIFRYPAWQHPGEYSN